MGRGAASGFGKTPDRWARFRRLLAYYLECVQEDRQQEVCFARDGRRVEYVPLSLSREWNLLEGADAQPRLPIGAAELLSKTGLRGQNAQLFYGYPLLAAWESPDGRARPSCFFLPLFTQPVELVPGRAFDGDGLRLRLTPDWPRVNREASRRLFGSTHEQDEVLEKLGLLEWSPDASPVRISDAVKKLVQLEVPLPLIEPLDPEDLAPGRYTGEGESGLLNRAILYSAEPSRYTVGLERELKELTKVSDVALDGTALAPLFADGWTPPQSPPGVPAVVEVVGLNVEQRQACEAALSAPLTAVTGPPGTGKSQVVINVLANAFLRGSPAIFSSRNHKAVSVVEERLFKVTDAPILFRLGSNDGLARGLIQALTQLMAVDSKSQAAEALKARREAYAAAVGHRQDVAKRIEDTRVARNEADRADLELERIRRKLTSAELTALEEARSFPDSEALRQAARLLAMHAPSSETKASGIVAALRRPFDVRRAKEILEEATRALPVIGELAPRTSGRSFLDAWLAQANRATEFVAAAHAVQRHRIALDALRRCAPLDQLFYEMNDVQGEIWRLGCEILELHRSQLGSALSHVDRSAAGDLLAVARQLVTHAPDTRVAWRLRKQLQELLPRVTRFLPSWAVTNLSAPGAIPFHAGLFDLAVIDEASQCDIPSAIPLLFRSKRAVIIGDPQQLRHITTLPLGRESQIAAKYRLTEAADQKFNFVTTSLFDLAAGSGSATMFALRDHYRSHEDIVGFSNAQWYGKDLRILTDYCGLKTPEGEQPGIKWVQAESEIFRPPNGGAIAPQEAARVVREVAELLEKPGFKGTIGVVTPFRAHANRIVEGLSRRLPGAAERFELIADTAHRFQGDERDVIVFSPCVAHSMPSGARRFLAKTANIFNVAVTRARAQLRVVGDLGACERSGIPHIEAFALHYRRLQAAAAGPVDESVGYFEKPLEEALRRAGVIAIPQYVFGRYRLDLAIVEDDVMIDIEVDGELFHKDLSGERCWEDLNRDRYLTQRGWVVLRFWAIEVRDRLDACVQRVLNVKAAISKRPRRRG